MPRTTTCTKPWPACPRRPATSSRQASCSLMSAEAQAVLDLVDWRRRVGDLYRITGPDARDQLFRTHPQSPLEPDERASFPGLRYFPHDPGCRVSARFQPGEGSELVI